MTELALSIAMIAVFLLGGGGIRLLVKRRDRKRGILMLVAALVIAANVAIWLAPLPESSDSLKNRLGLLRLKAGEMV